MNHTIYRQIQTGALILTLVVLGFSLYFEYVAGLQPCPLCLMQRLCAICFGVLCGLSFMMSRSCGLRLLTWVQFFVVGFGLFFAGRQMWLQSLPLDQAPMCMPSLSMVMKYVSWDVMVKTLFWGASDCASETGHWLGLSMPMWSAVYFSTMILFSAVSLWFLRSKYIR